MCCARLCGLILLLTLELQASAAPPTVNYLYPAGGQRGQTVEATAAGSFAHWPPQCRVNRQGLTVTPAKDKGKVSIAVAADAVPGAYLLQFYDAEGAAAPQPFIVGTLAEASEQEPNDSPDKPQTLSSAAVTVNGKLQKGGDVDAFSMGLMQGQTLVASLDANRTLGSPVDAVLQIASPRGTVLAQNDDERGLDPQLIFVAPSTGSYLVRVFGFPAAPNTTIALAGADTYVYRLTITTGAFLDAAFPLAVAKDASTSLELIGWNLPDAATRRELRPAAGAETVEVFDPSLADSLTLPVEPHPSLVEIEPNPPEQSQLVQLPVTLTGRIGDRRDKDAYRFSAKKGEVLRFQIESRDLGYPLDSVLELFKAEGGAPVARADDNAKQADADLTYTIPADGEYRIVVSDLYQHFGPRYVYRLRAKPAVPDFRLTIDAQAFTVAAGKPLEIPVKIDRQRNFAGEIAFQVEGLPPGASLATIKSLAKGDTAKTVKLVVTAGKEAFSGPIRIRGESTAAGGPMQREAEASLAKGAATMKELWLTVTAGGK